MRLLLGDCLDKLKELDDNSVDSIVTDPPYGLSFMGKKWDYDVPKKKVWKECMRVLKPGGYLLAFAGSRTYHQMAYRIEKAGFEIRDQIMWIYGSGFPKSLNIGKGVDKKLGNERESYYKPIAYPDSDCWGTPNNNSTGEAKNPSSYSIKKEKIAVQGGMRKTDRGNSEWEGWGTALKPAHEPIVMARKPLSEKTVVDNVLEWGTGGINIDDSRIGTDEQLGRFQKDGNGPLSPKHGFNNNSMSDGDKFIEGNPNGRFPANVIFDEEAGKILDEQSGVSKSTGGRSGNKEGIGLNGIYGDYKGIVTDENPGFGDIGGASRFFYCPKTSKTDRNEGLDDFEEKKSRKWRDDKGMKLTGSGNPRNEMSKNFHPTVKPTDLMLYLIRMVTPKGGTTLDPFMGSGSTGKAAVRGGFDFVGIEMDKEYMEIATARIQYEQDNPYNEEKGERVEINKNSNKFW